LWIGESRRRSDGEDADNERQYSQRSHLVSPSFARNASHHRNPARPAFRLPCIRNATTHPPRASPAQF
jgi:hypothetical protein